MYLNLFKAYEEKRLVGLKFDTIEDLEKLCLTDYRNLFFVLIYFYMTKRDLSSYNLRYNTVLLYPISLLCSFSGMNGITEYYSKYVNVGEMSEQIDSMLAEFRVSDDEELREEFAKRGI